jgi:nitronate monooxygenase
MRHQRLHTTLCDTFGIEHPIWLAGMGSQGRATPPALVAAVSEAGGMGMIGGANLHADELRRVIRAVRALTRKPIGVHLILPQPGAAASPTRGELRRQLAAQYPQHVGLFEALLRQFGLNPLPLDDDVAVSQAATADGGASGPRGDADSVLHGQLDVVFSEDVQLVGGAMGPIAGLRERARARGMPVLALASSVAQAIGYADEGADLIVAQGADAGGHVGRVGTFSLLPQVLSRVGVPVLAAGGIADGRGLAASLAFGAAGVWVGTAFLVAAESGIAPAQQQQIVDGRSEDFTANRVFSGSPMRGYRNAVVRAWEASGLQILPAPYQKILMDDLNASAAAAGRWDLHSNPAGEAAGLLSAVRPATEIVAEMVRDAGVALARAAGAIEPLARVPTPASPAQSALSRRVDLQSPLATFEQCHLGITKRLQAAVELPLLLGPARRAREVAADTLDLFDHAVLAHHAEEEGELFPAVMRASRSGEERDRVQAFVDRLMRDHRHIEQLWRGLEPAVVRLAEGQPAEIGPTALQELLEAYTRHARFEEDEFLPLCEQILGRENADLSLLGLSLHMRRHLSDDGF